MKKIMAFVLSILMMVMSLTITTVSAATDDKNAPTVKEIVSELEKYRTPYYEDNYDFNNDGVVDVFDMVALRKKLTSGEDGITIATAVKLNRWLLGKDTTLGISEYAHTWKYPNETDMVENYLSNDFRFVDVYEGTIVHPYNEEPAVVIRFLGIDEYVSVDIFIDTFCNSSDEFDEFIAEGTGYSIGVKNKHYALALNASKENDEDLTAPEASAEDTTEETVTEEKINSSFIQYDLTKPNLSSAEVIETLNEVSNSLNATPYSFTLNKISSDKIELSGKNEISEINIIVREFEPVREFSITETDTFYLFYDNTRGFGILVK